MQKNLNSKKRKKLFSLIFLILFSAVSFCEEFTIKADKIEADAKNQLIFLYGNCIVEGKSVKLKADNVKIDKKNGVIVANGNVFFSKNAVSGKGEKLIFYTDSKQATIFKGQLLLNGEYRFYAKEINYLSGDRYSLKNCTFTTCPEGCDYWGFKAKKINIKKEGYAKFNSLKFKINNKSVFYLPFFIYPAKTKRTFGLLIPELGNSSKHGFNYNQELFIPIGNPQDITLGIDYYSKAGTGTTFEYRESFRKGEFGKIYVYTIKDKLINQRRTIGEAEYSYNISGKEGIEFDAFFGDDYKLIRDYTFTKYDLAMRDFYLYGGYFKQFNKFSITASTYMQKPFMDNSAYYFSTIPSLSLYGENFKFWGRNLKFKANFSLISDDKAEDTYSRDYFEFNSYKFFNKKWINIKENLKIKTVKYSSDKFENISSIDFSYKFNLPYLEKSNNTFTNLIKPFVQIGIRDKSGKANFIYHDIEDYTNPSGLYLKTGINSCFVFSDKIAIFSLYGEKTLNSSQKFSDISNPTLQSDYSTFNAYLSLPVTSNFYISSLIKYNPKTNKFDTFTVNTRLNTLYLTYFRGYVYGEDKSRNSLIGRYDQRITNRWKATLQFDYDFSLNDFRYKRLTLSYYKKCIGVNLTYQNNSYSTITTNQFTVSLVLRSIGELFKYRLGL